MSDRIEIIKELRALEQFCAFPPKMSGEDRERFLKDYLADVQEFPFSAIQAACAAWRRTGSTKFPTPGQLIPLIKHALPLDKGEAPLAWRELSHPEYNSLSLREKIRHRTILAHEARRKAGPMWKTPAGSGLKRPTPGHIHPDAMPDTYRRWSAIAEAHEAEAKRLRTFLGRDERLAAE